MQEASVGGALFAVVPAVVMSRAGTVSVVAACACSFRMRCFDGLSDLERCADNFLPVEEEMREASIGGALFGALTAVMLGGAEPTRLSLPVRDLS